MSRDNMSRMLMMKVIKMKLKKFIKIAKKAVSIGISDSKKPAQNYFEAPLKNGLKSLKPWMDEGLMRTFIFAPRKYINKLPELQYLTGYYYGLKMWKDEHNFVEFLEGIMSLILFLSPDNHYDKYYRWLKRWRFWSFNKIGIALNYIKKKIMTVIK